MNINNNVQKPGIDNTQLQQQQNASNKQVAANQGQSKAAVATDSVSLTQSAQHLAQLQKKGSDTVPVNQEKIEKLKKAIHAGQYKIDPDKLAENIAKYESQLFGIK